MAYGLKEKGFTNVTILEKSNRVGGKAETFTYRDTTIPLAVLLYTSVYNETLLPLLRKFGIKTPHDDAPIGDFATCWPVNNDSIHATKCSLGSSLSWWATKEEEAKIFLAYWIYYGIFYEFFGHLNNRYGVSWIKCLNIHNKKA